MSPFVQLPQIEVVAFTRGRWLWLGSEDSNDERLAPADPAAYAITLNVDGSLGLRVDCNLGAAEYESEGSAVTIRPGPMTQVGCAPGSLDSVFLRDLSEVATYVFDGTRLVLNLSVDTGTMVFAPAPPTGLFGDWTVGQAARTGGLLAATSVTATANLDEGGDVAGDSGCNSYRGVYVVAGANIDFGTMVSTKRACLSQSANAQEAAILAAFDAATYRLEGDSLALFAMDGTPRLVLRQTKASV